MFLFPGGGHGNSVISDTIIWSTSYLFHIEFTLVCHLIGVHFFYMSETSALFRLKKKEIKIAAKILEKLNKKTFTQNL